MARYPGFVGPSAVSRSKIASDDRLVNLYPEKVESGTAKAPYVLYRTPGLREWCDLGVTDPVRGEFTLNGATFAVAGTKLYEVPFTLGGTATVRATGLANPDDGPVSMAGNGDGGFQIVIAAGSRLYCFDVLTDTLTLIPDIAAVQVVFMNATFFALDGNTSTVYASAPEDGSSWDLGDAAQRTSAPDRLQAIARVGTELWLFGLETISPYYDAGAADFPLTPNPNIFIQRGLLAVWSVAVTDGKAIWIGSGPDGGASVYLAQGYTPTRVSTHAVEYAFSQYSTIADAEAHIYLEEGHLFYQLTFPTADATWVYDVTSGLWHEREEYNGTSYGMVPIRGHVYANGVHLVGSRTTGVIYQQGLDIKTNSDGVTGVRWLRRAPHLCEELKAVGYDRFQLDAQVGVGLASGQGSDPQVALRWSDDGGQSFGNIHWNTLGAVGQYATRVEWRKLGAGRDRVFEVYGSDPVVIALIDAYLDVRQGAS